MEMYEEHELALSQRLEMIKTHEKIFNITNN